MPDIPRYAAMDGTVAIMLSTLRAAMASGGCISTSKIQAWDPDAGCYCEVTGIVIHPNGIIQIQTDED